MEITVSKEITGYNKNLLLKLGIFVIPAQLYNCIKTTTSLPDLDFGDIWSFCNPSLNSAYEMKNNKATDSHKYAVSGWVNQPEGWLVDLGEQHIS